MLARIILLVAAALAPVAVTARTTRHRTTDLSCPSPSTCTPISSCTTSGCQGNCIAVPPPTSLEPCVISDPVSTCGPSSICTQTSPCSTSGCGGLCLSTQAPLSTCIISDPAHGCTESGRWTCTQTSPCSTSGCGGLCLSLATPVPTKKCTITVSPTGPTMKPCKIDDLTSSCDQEPVSSCAGANGCTTSGCEGTCTERGVCDPLPTTGDGGFHLRLCDEGEYCSSYSGSGHCHTITPTPTPTANACKIDDLTSSCNQEPVSSCAGANGCTTSGCEGTCTERGACDPVPTSLDDDVHLSLCNEGEYCSSYSGSGYCHTTTPTVTPTEPPLLTRTYDCLVSVTGHCAVMQQCEPWYGSCCDTLNCPGRCVQLGAYPTTSSVVDVTKTVTVYTTSA